MQKRVFLTPFFACVFALLWAGCGPGVHGTDVSDQGQPEDVTVIEDTAPDGWSDDGRGRPDAEVVDDVDVVDVADTADAVDALDVQDSSDISDSDDADVPDETGWPDIVVPVDVALDLLPGDVPADEGSDEGNDSGFADVTDDPGGTDTGFDTGSDTGTDAGHQDAQEDPGSTDVPDPCADAGQLCFITSGACRSDGFEVCLPDGSGTECNAAPIVVGPEACDGIDNDCDAETDNIPSALTKRAVLNCYADSSRTIMLPVADCWNMLAPDTGVSPSPTIQVDVQFVDAATPCSPADGINMCVSSAITTCTAATLIDACITEMAFEILLFGTQYRYSAASDNISCGFDKTQDSVVGAMQILSVPAGSPAGCTILYNTFSCQECNIVINASQNHKGNSGWM